MIDDIDDIDDAEAPVDEPPVDAPVAPVDVAADVAADAAVVDAVPVEAAPAEETGPPFVLEEWVLDAIEALVFASNEPLSPSRAREIIAAEMETMDGLEGKGPPTLGDMKRAFRALLDRWSRLTMRTVPPPPPPRVDSAALLAPLPAAPAAAPPAAATPPPTQLDAAPLEAVEAHADAAVDAALAAATDAAVDTPASDAAHVEPAHVEAAPEAAPVEAAPVEAAPVEEPDAPEVPVEHASLRGFRLVEIDGALTFRTAASQSRFVRRMQMGKPQRLSRASLETLAVIAYRQPVTKPQVEEVRGVDSSGAIKMLLDKRLIRVLGKAEEIGRPLLYGTTKTFLEFFEMQSLNDLPTLKELHELEHGVDPSTVEDKDDRPAVIMDLFNADHVSAVSEETERESTEAMEALEKALGEAKDVAKRASTLVFGMQVEDGEDAPRAPTSGGAPPEPATAPAEEGGIEKKDEEPKA